MGSEPRVGRGILRTSRYAQGVLPPEACRFQQQHLRSGVYAPSKRRRRSRSDLICWV